MMAALIYRWDGRPEKLSFEIIPDSYNSVKILRWCHRLIRAMSGQRAYLVWDRLPAHRNGRVITLLAEHGIEVVFLPGYAPNLNPTEWLWANLKGTVLANFCAEDISHAANEARRGLKRLKRRLSLLNGFLAGAGLSFGSK